MSDPAYPDRPDHEDFWKISRAVIANDDAAESQPESLGGIGAINARLAQFVDPDTVWYMAQQRVRRHMQGLKSILQSEEGVDALARASWVDGFMAACAAEDIPTVFTIDGIHRERKSL